MQKLFVVSHKLWIAKVLSNTKFHFFHKTDEHCSGASLWQSSVRAETHAKKETNQ
jgi:hypothetical protein